MVVKIDPGPSFKFEPSETGLRNMAEGAARRGGVMADPLHLSLPAINGGTDTAH